MLEAKNYKVELVGSFSGESAEKKTPYFGLELETACGEFIDWVAYLTDNTAKRNLTLLAEAGFKGKKLADLSNDKLSMEDLFDKNNNLSITVEHEEYTDKQGEIKTKAVVKWFNTGNFGAAKADHKQAVKIFGGTKFDGMLKELKGTIKPKKTETKNSEATEEEDDDIPF